MPLASCKVCKHAVAEDAWFCPACGIKDPFPSSSTHAWRLALAFLAGAAVVLGVVLLAG